jgi:hypothetical protein
MNKKANLEGSMLYGSIYRTFSDVNILEIYRSVVALETSVIRRWIH